MISYYPLLLLPHLTRKKSVYRGPLRELFFQSWEDALWYLIDCGIIKRGNILIPDFYCLDVVGNMRSHGLTPLFYPLDSNLQPMRDEFAALLKSCTPSCVIIFHAAGITSDLAWNSKWREALSPNTRVIHDFVHRLERPGVSGPHQSGDIVIDSLRKNLPLPGSHLYLPESVGYIPAPSVADPHYIISARIRYGGYRLCLTLGHFLKSGYLIRLGHKNILAGHDRVIGDSRHGCTGPKAAHILSQYVAWDRIADVKRRQEKKYRYLLAPFIEGSSMLTIPPSSPEDILHALPVVVQGLHGQRLITKLEKLNVWTKFPDSPWSRNRKVIFLPLGLHITTDDQIRIVEIIRRWILRGQDTPRERRVEPKELQQALAATPGRLNMRKET